MIAVADPKRGGLQPRRGSTYMIRRSSVVALLFTVATTAPAVTAAQGTAADYERATTVAERTDGLVVDLPEAPNWVSGSRFWYRKSVKGGNVFVLVDADSGIKRPAFDHERIAAALGKATGHPVTATTLPFKTITFVDGSVAIDVTVEGATWRCALVLSACTRHETTTKDANSRAGRRNAAMEEGGGRGNIPPTLFGGGYYGDNNRTADGKPRVSPDGKTEAFVRDDNIWTRPVGSTESAQL